MEFLESFSFLSKYKTHIHIDNGTVRIELEGTNEDFDELKNYFDGIKLMEKYNGFEIKFDEITVSNIALTKNFYGGHVRGILTLREGS